MKIFWTLLNRELATYFMSAAAYVTMVVTLAVTGAGFWLQMTLPTDESFRPDVAVFLLPTLWLMALIAATVLTMRLFAEEKKSGTLESLMTVPVTEIQVVLGKYVAAVAMFALTFLPTVSYIFIARRCSFGMEPVDLGALAAGYLCFFLIGAFYLSMGLAVSCMCRNQITAAIVTFSLFCCLFMGVSLLPYVASGMPAEVAAFLSPVEHVKDFGRGAVDTRPVVFYAGGTIFMLFATTRILESRRWI